MLMRKLQTVAGLILAVGLACGGAGILWRSAGTTPAAAADRPAATRGADAAPSGGTGPAGVAADFGFPVADAPPGRVPEGPPASPPHVLASPTGAGARPPQTRIGIINLTRAFQGSKRFQALQADLRTQAQAMKRRLETQEQQVRVYQEQAVNPATSADARERLDDQVRQLRREIEDTQESAKRKMNKLHDDALVGLYREVEDAANRVAKLDGLELVLFYNDAVTEADYYNPANLQRKLSQPGLVPMIAAPGLDITDAVIDALNQAHAPPDGPRR